MLCFLSQGVALGFTILPFQGQAIHQYFAPRIQLF